MLQTRVSNPELLERAKRLGAVRDRITTAAAENGEGQAGPLDAILVESVDNQSKPVLASWDVFVRDDGTVDVDAALETGREVVRLSSELWERLNGKPPGSESGATGGFGATLRTTLPRLLILTQLLCIHAGLSVFPF